jgi:hypothetical protein
MLDSFESWATADKAWATENEELLREAYGWFYQTHEWPKVVDLQRLLHKKGDRITDVEHIAQSKPSTPGSFLPQPNQIITLSARHLIMLPEAQPLLEALVVATRVAVKAYLDGEIGKSAQISKADIAAVSPFEDATLALIPEFVWSDYPSPFMGGGKSETDWHLFVSDHFILKFEGISTVRQYVDAQLRVLRSDYQKRMPLGFAGHARGPVKVFVAMPFTESWSSEVYDFIRHVANDLSVETEVVRVDKIPFVGSITSQIVAELTTADIVIADITGNNSNVAWELGFAYALEKPTLIIRQKDDVEQVPFDIYDQRRLEYGSLELAFDECKTLLQYVIDELLSDPPGEIRGHLHNR